MCGICGICRFDSGSVNAEQIGPMIRSLRHRGPDEEGVHLTDCIGFGHSRLSIIDLSGGSQPISNEDGRIWIVFNGEIFNYVELREDLKGRGHLFKTQTDTEVILHLYEEEGERCVCRLNGQWAFAIWDGRARKLFLSRDRLGIRPLFYTFGKNSFLFASEIKALFSAPDVPREIDPAGLDQIFTFWNTIPPRTAFRNIRQLSPGHSISIREGETRIYPYWSFRFDGGFEYECEQTARERLRELLIEATRIRLRADVPVGAYLSGGLDSTVIAAVIKRFSDAPLRTFSVTFTQPEYDEKSYQREAVRHLGTSHSTIECTCDDIARVFPQVIRHTESPILRTAPAPLYILSRLVRDNGMKVVLTGEGADEILGGYDIYKEAKIRTFWSRRPDSRLRPLLLRRLYPYMPNMKVQSDAYLQSFFHVAPGDLEDPFFSHLPRWRLTGRLKSFFSDDLKSQLAGYDASAELLAMLPADYHRWDFFSQAQFLETTTLLPGYILSSQGDRMAMAHSVEGRFPFLDYRVAELAARIPPQLKMKALNEKYILKQAMGDLIPDSILHRSKQPYRAPDSQSFFDGVKPRQEYVEEMLSARRLKGYGLFNPAAVGLLVKKIKGGRALGVKDNMALVGILSTHLLMEQVIHCGGVQ